MPQFAETIRRLSTVNIKKREYYTLLRTCASPQNQVVAQKRGHLPPYRLQAVGPSTRLATV